MLVKLKKIFIPCQENDYRPKFLDSQLLLYYIIGLLILKLITVPFFIYFPKSIFFADITKTSLIKLINNERESLGLASLKDEPRLDKAAYLKASDMIEKGYFSHISPDSILPWYWIKISGYDYKSAGENLAIGFLDSEEVFKAWINSPLHRENILNPNYRDTGIAVLKGNFQGNETTVIVQFFGSKKELIAEKPKAKPLNNTGVGEVREQKEKASAVSKEEVLHIPTEKNMVLSARKVREAKEDNFFFKFFYFFSFKYNSLIQKIIYSSLILIIFSLLINLIVKFDIRHRDLVFKAFCFIGLLILLIIFDKEEIIQFISHNFRIY